MTVSKHTETIETLAQEREKAKQQLNYWTQREKILSHQITQLTPKERSKTPHSAQTVRTSVSATDVRP